MVNLDFCYVSEMFTTCVCVASQIDTDGLRSLLTTACLSFPLDAKHLLSLCDSLASASHDSALQVTSPALVMRS